MWLLGTSLLTLPGISPEASAGASEARLTCPGRRQPRGAAVGAQIANRERFPSAAPDGAAPCSGGVSRFTATAWTPAPAQEPRPRRGCPGSRALPSPGPRAPRDGAGRLRFCVPPAAPVWGFPQELQQVLGTANGGRQSPATPHGTGTTLCPSLRGYRTLPTHTLNSGSQDRTEARPGSQRVCPGRGPS